MAREDKLLAAFEQVYIEIMATIGGRANLEDDEQAQRLIQQLRNKMERLNVDAEKVIPETILSQYVYGTEQATGELREADQEPPGTVTITSGGQIEASAGQQVHAQAAQRLSQDTLADFQAAIRYAADDIESNITQALDEVNRQLTAGVITGEHSKARIRAVQDAFRKNGINGAETIDGKKLRIDKYAKLVTRTKLRESQVAGSTNRYQDADIQLVEIEGRNDTCAHCARFHGMVVALEPVDGFPTVGDNGITLPPYHPHCRCTVRPVALDRLSQAEREAIKGRNAKYQPGADPRTPAQKKAYEEMQKKRRKAFQELQQYEKLQAVLGKDAPKSIGGFRNMRRQNSKNYRKMMAEYRKKLHNRNVGNG